MIEFDILGSLAAVLLCGGLIATPHSFNPYQSAVMSMEVGNCFSGQGFLQELWFGEYKV
jgi:hypothetical protein